MHSMLVILPRLNCTLGYVGGPLPPYRLYPLAIITIIHAQDLPYLSLSLSALFWRYSLPMHCMQGNVKVGVRANKMTVKKACASYKTFM